MTGDAAPDGDPALRATDLDQAFGEVTVLSEVSVTVDRGEVAAVVGPNGSGKSTLLRVLAGISAPDAGSVAVPRHAGGARSVGFLPQRPAFRSGFTARDTLQFYARLLDGVDDDDVATTLDRIGLGSVADRSVGSLSGGMTRLLGLGQAVLGDPAVLVLDEPGSGLDPAMVERLFGILGDLAAEGAAVIVASHELPAVEAHADTVYVLDDGGFVASGAPETLLDETGAASLSEAFLRVVRAETGESTVRAGAGAGAGTGTGTGTGAGTGTGPADEATADRDGEDGDGDERDGPASEGDDE
ncbi:MAG: ABC transporter ATP-binding protein [Haloquadratum sp.]